MAAATIQQARDFATRTTRHVSVQVEGVQVAAFVDGGADVSCASLRWVQTRVPGYADKLQGTDARIQEATSSGSSSAVAGKIRLKLYVGGEHTHVQYVTLLVLRGLNYDVVLGADTPTRYGASLDYHTQACTLRVSARTAGGTESVRLPLLAMGDAPTSNDQAAAPLMGQSLCLAEPFTLPPRTSADLPVFAQHVPASEGMVMVEPLTATTKKRGR